MSFAAPNRRLYVGRIPQDANRLDVEDHFASAGPRPADVKVLNGYGFVEYDTLEDAEKAKDHLDNRDFMGDRLLVQFAKASERRRYDDGPSRGGDSYRGPGGGGRGGREQGWRLLITNLPNGCSWQDLKDFARTAGNVHYTEVSRNDPSEGVIEYLSHGDAEHAIKALDGVDMRGSVVRVTENTAPAGQSWADPRASPPRRERDDDRRGGGDRGYGGDRDRGYGGDRGGDRGYGGRRERSRSPPRRRDDRDDRDRRDYGRDDDRDRRAGSSRRERSRSPPKYGRDRSRSPR